MPQKVTNSKVFGRSQLELNIDCVPKNTSAHFGACWNAHFGACWNAHFGAYWEAHFGAYWNDAKPKKQNFPKTFDKV